MRTFSTRLSALLSIVLIVLLAFVAIAVAAGTVVVIADRIAPGSVGTVMARGGATGPIDLAAPGAAPAFVAMMLVMLAVVAAAILPLIGMLKSTAAGDPFVAANVRRLHIIAGAIGTAIILQIVLPPLVPAGLAGMIVPGHGSDVFALLLTLVLAEVFREGVRLREDAEGTI